MATDIGFSQNFSSAHSGIFNISFQGVKPNFGLGVFIYRDSLNFPITKTISGVIRDNENQLVSRRVLAYDRVTGGLLSETFSDPVSGEYSLSVPDREINIVVQDDSGAPVLNDLIARVLP